MEKELPKMYHSSINKQINNVQNVFSTINNEFDNDLRSTTYNKFEIDNKINDIFNSPNFVYKADVNILTDKGLLNKRIIAKKNGYLITIDNETIPINIIKDIYI